MSSQSQRLGSVKAAAKAKMIRNARKSRVHDLLAKGVHKDEIIKMMGLSRSTINSYIRD